MSIEAMKLALEALENHSGNYKLSKAECVKYRAVEEALRQAIEQAQKQEPVAWIKGKEVSLKPPFTGHADGWEPLYKQTPQHNQIKVWGWVWKDKRQHEGCYVPSYTPAQHVERGELLALVDASDLHEPLKNTKWHTPSEAAHGITGE